jgi:4-hydroxy-3-methylbut-2-enyl diphosphate reductase
MESAWLSTAAHDRPFVVVRAVSDGPGRELSLRRPLRSAAGGIAALRTLDRVGPAFDAWSRALMPSGRRVLLAGPRSFCAGVERAVEIVERALDRHGPPVFVRKQIVHNVHVVHDLEARGAVFVDEVDEVPEGAMVIFSAHGVSPEVRRKSAERNLVVIDATCPLVTKVHAEAKRFARNGYTIFLVGHEGHEEVEGTTGEAPDSIRLIDPEGAADAMDGVGDPERVAFLTQTTLAVDEVRSVVGGLRERFPLLAAPGSDDICYATQNRQDAVKAIAAECDVLLAIGSDNSSNSKRLVEVAEREGCSAHLIDDGRDIRLEWLAGAATIGLTAGASAPDSLVRDVVAELEGLGPVSVEHRTIGEEDVRFTLPVELRR